jgi:hypothetical protein
MGYLELCIHLHFKSFGLGGERASRDIFHGGRTKCKKKMLSEFQERTSFGLV